jgi:hypothetical protein
MREASYPMRYVSERGCSKTGIEKKRKGVLSQDGKDHHSNADQHSRLGAAFLKSRHFGLAVGSVKWMAEVPFTRWGWLFPWGCDAPRLDRGQPRFFPGITAKPMNRPGAAELGRAMMISYGPCNAMAFRTGICLVWSPPLSAIFLCSPRDAFETDEA